MITRPLQLILLDLQLIHRLRQLVVGDYAMLNGIHREGDRLSLPVLRCPSFRVPLVSQLWRPIGARASVPEGSTSRGPRG